ncbi:MAG: hypothetical protein V4672_12890 [Verrucomicrobiota bacterium]
MLLEIPATLAVQSGSVADWVAAVGTAGSLFAALYMINKERKERRRIADELPFQQALLVNAWSESEKEGHVLFAHNGTNQPVFDVMVYASPVDYVPHESGPSHKVEVLFGTLAPGRLLDDKAQTEKLNSDRFGEPTVELEFTDSAGRHWRRGGYERNLVEIKSRRPFD